MPEVTTVPVLTALYSDHDILDILDDLETASHRKLLTGIQYLYQERRPADRVVTLDRSRRAQIDSESKVHVYRESPAPCKTSSTQTFSMVTTGNLTAYEQQ